MAQSRPQSLLLAALAACVLPFSIGCLLFNYAILALAPRKTLRKAFRRTPGFKAKKILVTGIATPYGLRLARAFHQVGHNVVGADYQDTLLPLHTRLSISLLRFRRLKAAGNTEVAKELLAIVQIESASLWIDCSQTIPPTTLAAARNLIEQSTSCICFAPSDQVVASFSTPQSFIRFVYQHGLPVPDSHFVKSRDDIHTVLNQSRGKKRYALRGPDSPTPTNPRALLPRRTLSQTYNEVAKFEIKNSQWVLEQYLEGLKRLKTISIVAKGELQAFTACEQTPTGEYQVLSSMSLQTALIRYTAALTQHLGHDANCHVCIDFCIDEKATETGVEQRILPVDGRLSTSTTCLAFQGTDGSLDLVRAYLSALSTTANGSMASGRVIPDAVEEEVLRPSNNGKEVYSLGTEVFRLLQCLFEFLSLQVSLSNLIGTAFDFVKHLLFDQECMYDFHDPLPCWYLYQMYVPLRLFISCFQDSQTRAGLGPHVKHMIT